MNSAMASAGLSPMARDRAPKDIFLLTAIYVAIPVAIRRLRGLTLCVSGVKIVAVSRWKLGSERQPSLGAKPGAAQEDQPCRMETGEGSAQ